MKVKFSPLLLATACGLSLFAQVSVAQTSIQLFGEVNTAQSLTGVSYTNPYAFNTNTLNLTCPTSGIQATLSGPLMNGGETAPALLSGALQPGGNLLVDNNIIVTVTPTGNGLATPANVCPASGVTITGQGLYNGNCFNSTYEFAAAGILGQNPDTFDMSPSGQTVDYAGGVPPIDISPYLSTSGTAQSVTIALTDEGGQVAGSTVFLVTNCTQGPVTGPAQISGNSITGGGTPSGLTQTFNFNTGNGQVVGFVYDVGGANSAGSLTDNTSGSTPISGDLPIDPTTFQPSFVSQTSFATSNCLIHTGEALPNGNPACKLYTLECTNGTNGPAGANCPVSDLDNEVVQDIFDGPPFSLPNISTPTGTFHEGIGFLTAADDWSATSGGPCSFNPASHLTTLPCPQNLLDSFTGPGGFSGTGITTNPNSTFISIYGVPQDNTSVSVKGEFPPHWNNTLTPTIYFSSLPPNFTKGASVLSGSTLVPLPNAANFIPAPIKSVTFGISPLNSPLPMPINEPIANDVTLPSATCPVPLPTTKTEPTFSASQQVTFPADGQYLIHYYAQDCAGTQELLFTMAPVTGVWSTNFYTHPIAIDTTPPAISGLSMPPLNVSGGYKVGSVQYVTYTCTDATSGAGVVQCGTKNYAHDSTYNTGTLKTQLNTSTVGGPYTITVHAVDGAGNSVSKSATYTVTH